MKIYYSFSEKCPASPLVAPFRYKTSRIALNLKTERKTIARGTKTEEVGKRI